MLDREAETLSALSIANEKQDWIRPRDIGGSDNSLHAQTLIRMGRKGWVNVLKVQAVNAEARGGRSWHMYRITKAGRQALANHNALMAAAQ